MDNPTATPNPTPAAAGNEPAPSPAGGEPATPAPAKPMGTTPTGHRNTPDAGTTPAEPAAPTTDPSGEGTEGGQAPAATPQNNGQGDDPKPDVDYKTKFSESSKEAQRLLQVLKDAGIDPQTGQPIAAPGTEQPTGTRTEPEGVPTEPTPQPQAPLTDDQLAQAIPGFHNLSEAEKTMLRDTKATVKQMAAMQKLVTEMYDERMYKQQFADLTGKDQFKAIAEHADEFKELAYKDENLKVPLETLAGNFLYQKGLAAKPAEKLAEPPAPSGVEPGSGGGKKGAGKTQDGYTAEEIAQIRKTDPKRYAKLAREGKLKVRT